MSQTPFDEALLERLGAYADGELGGLARWRLERQLRRSPALRKELEALLELSARISEALPAAGDPDLWPALALRLPAADARRAEAVRSRRPGRGWAWGGAALAASLALVAVFTLRAPAPVAIPASELPGDGGVVRWLDTGGRDVMVLEASSDTTIIWVFEDADESAGGGVLRDVV